MPNFTPILSAEDLTPFRGCFVSIIKSNGEDATAYFSGETGELWLIRYQSNWPSLDKFNAMAATAWLAHLLELRERDTKFLIKLDDAYFKCLSNADPIQLAHMAEPEIQKHKALFQDKKISLFPNSACPDSVTAISLLEAQQARWGNPLVDTAATKISLHTIIKQTCSELRAQSWKSLPAHVMLKAWEANDELITDVAKPRELVFLCAEILLPFNEGDRNEIRTKLSGLLTKETNIQGNAKQKIRFSTRVQGQQGRLLVQAFSSEAMQSNSPLTLINQLEKNLLEATDPQLSFDRFTPPRQSSGQFGFFSERGDDVDPMRPIHFSEDVIPYAGQIVFYETVACQSKGAEAWFDCIKLGEKYVYPAYISRYVSNEGLNYCYKLSQFACIYDSAPITRLNTGGKDISLDYVNLASLKLHLRLPSNDELIELKKAYEEGRLKLIINSQHPCTLDEFSELVDSQCLRSEQQQSAQNLRLGV